MEPSSSSTPPPPASNSSTPPHTPCLSYAKHGNLTPMTLATDHKHTPPHTKSTPSIKCNDPPNQCCCKNTTTQTPRRRLRATCAGHRTEINYGDELHPNREKTDTRTRSNLPSLACIVRHATEHGPNAQPFEAATINPNRSHSENATSHKSTECRAPSVIPDA